jgi:hypothetical protein
VSLSAPKDGLAAVTLLRFGVTGSSAFWAQHVVAQQPHVAPSSEFQAPGHTIPGDHLPEPWARPRFAVDGRIPGAVDLVTSRQVADVVQTLLGY